MTKTPLRIALVITELEVGGAERCLANVAAGLDRNRFSPVIYSLAPRPAIERGALVASLARADVPVRFLGFSSKWRLPAAVRCLARHLAQQQPHVVQSMLFHANVVAAAATRGIDARGLSLGIRVAEPSRWRQWLERRLALRAHRITCVSQSVADYAAGRLRIPSSKLCVIPNGFDLRRCANVRPADLQSMGVPPSQRVITCVTRLAYQKGVDRLIRVAGTMLESLPQHDLLLVGDGPQAAALRRKAARLGIASRVHFAGWREDVLEVLLASDLMVLPSRWEGMPNALLEAMACGRPVVCTRVEGVEEVLGPLAEPQTVAADDLQAFAHKVVAIIRDPDLSGLLGIQNRQRIDDFFSLPVMIQRYEELFEAVARGA
jgi:glycosyltransferase involved in cell wall biosynthesis